MKKQIVSLTLVLLIPFFNAVAQSSNVPSIPSGSMTLPGVAHSSQKGMLEFFRELNLTDSQRQKLREMRQGRAEIQQRFKEMAEQRDAIDAALRDSAVSDQYVLQLAQKLNQMSAQRNLERINRLLQLKKILDPQQFAQFLSKVQQKRETFRGQMRQRFEMRKEWRAPNDKPGNSRIDHSEISESGAQ